MTVVFQTDRLINEDDRQKNSRRETDPMWYNSHFFIASVKIVLILIIILLGVQVLPYLYPILSFFIFLLSPMIVSLALYYLLRPFVEKMRSHRIPFCVAIIIVFLSLGLFFTLVGTFVVPVILAPLHDVAEDPLKKAEEVRLATIEWLNVFHFYSYEEVKNFVTTFLSKSRQYMLYNTFTIVSTLTHFAFIVVITPFALFYFLKDGKNFHQSFVNCIPKKYQARTESTLKQIDDILMSFFHGQITIAFICTTLAFIGLSLIDIDNIMFLTFITFFLTLIPYIGTLLAIIPPVLGGLADNYVMTLAAAGVMVSIHLTESNIITPQVMRKKFDIHPLAVVLLVVGSFSLFGFLGPLWITPVYVLFRELLIEAYKFLYPPESD